MDATLVILLDIIPLQSRPQATDITCGVPKGFAPHFLRRVGAHQHTGEIPIFRPRLGRHLSSGTHSPPSLPGGKSISLLPSSSFK